MSIEEYALEDNAWGYSNWEGEHDPRREAAPGVKWRGLDFSGADLSGLDLSDADLSNCMLGNVAGTRFVGANLSGVSFGWSRADARGCDFTNAILAGADIANANFAGATIHLARDLTDADLVNTIGLTPEQIKACRAKGAVVD